MKVFISHSSDDKRFVRTLKTDLNENGVHTWFDEDELNFGDSLADKLETSIDDTSHFLIILSESSINSVWVQKELNYVLNSLNKRIIPIKYKECDVPKNLSTLLFGDVSSITRVVDGDRLLFKDEKYYSFVNMLLKALKGESNRLTEREKKILTSNVKINEDSEVKSTYFKFRIIAYSNSKVREEYSAKVAAQLSREQLVELGNDVKRPVIFPKVLKELYNEIKPGAKVLFRNTSGEIRTGIFAGFRTSSDDVIVLPVSITNYLNLTTSKKIFDFAISNDQYEMIIL
jgi:hypothetical protein